MTEWRVCDAVTWKHELRGQLFWEWPYPNGDPPMISSDCPYCGHMLALHSDARGCVGCELLQRTDQT